MHIQSRPVAQARKVPPDTSAARPAAWKSPMLGLQCTTVDHEIRVSDYVSVADRAAALGLKAPTSIALLPRNFDSATKADELLDEATAATVHQLWRQANVAEERFDSPEEPTPSVAEHAADWIAPIIFVSGTYASGNPDAISVALGVVSNYVYELFGRLPGRHRARLDVVVERSPRKTTKRITYEGDAEGVTALLPAVEKMLRDGD